MNRGRALCMFLACSLIAAAHPAFGQSTVFKRRRSTSYTYNRLAPLTVGTGVDFEKSDEERETAFPLLMEYGFTQFFRVTAEGNGVFIDSMDPDVGKVTGFDDLETAIEYEAIHERRYTPALTATGMMRWPTANRDTIGNPGRDYTLGVIASKDLVHFDLDLNVLYTFSGDPEEPNIVETSLGGAYPLNWRFELEAEVVQTIGITGPDRTGANETEGTVGFSWLMTRYQTLEMGLLRKNDGTWGASVGWQYSFGGE